MSGLETWQMRHRMGKGTQMWGGGDKKCIFGTVTENIPGEDKCEKQYGKESIKSIYRFRHMSIEMKIRRRKCIPAAPLRPIVSCTMQSIRPSFSCPILCCLVREECNNGVLRGEYGCYEKGNIHLRHFRRILYASVSYVVKVRANTRSHIEAVAQIAKYIRSSSQASCSHGCKCRWCQNLC
jgi:hypothetical protein